MTKDTTINIRIDAKTKKKAEKIFARCGYTTSQAVRLFLLRTIKENDWPFDIHIPNEETIAALENPEYLGKPMSVDEFMAEVQKWKNEPDDEVVTPKAKRNARR